MDKSAPDNRPVETCEGGCACGTVRYRMSGKPLVVHCCHCTRCQRQSGAAFALNALIEADRVELLKGEIENTILETASGKGQRISRCSKCKIAVWSEYLIVLGGKIDAMYFVRVGTMDNPELLPPDLHIHTSAKQSWFVLPPDALAMSGNYDNDELWSSDSLERFNALRKRISQGSS